ncbi:MAG TPA: DUF433 domain-containing protein [Pyrinomonadaceae bacterium]|nr:DUF433 domain-containing protein [Pyrinomonadaceae bacterium]
MTLDAVQTVPLTQWEDGSIRVRDTRLLVDMIIYAHKRGLCPEEIYDSFPSSSYTVADIYAVIAYYLSHKSEIDSYLANRETESEAAWKKIESDPKHLAFRSELRKRKEDYLKNGS